MVCLLLLHQHFYFFGPFVQEGGENTETTWHSGQNKMYIIGLTGGIACGKSTVSTLLKEKDIAVIDADLIAREVVMPGTAGYKAIVAHFGSKVPNLVNEDGSLNRADLGSYVFANKDELRVLNGITHPAVRRTILKRLLMSYFQRLVILDVPLLFESGLDVICSSAVTVSCSSDLQLSRLLNRNSELSEEEAQQRIKSQMADEERRERADYVVENNGSLESLEQDVQKLVKNVKPSLFSWIIGCFPPVAMGLAIWSYYKRVNKNKRIKKD